MAELTTISNRCPPSINTSFGWLRIPTTSPSLRLQLLVGGWSGTVVYLVSVSWDGPSGSSIASSNWIVRARTPCRMRSYRHSTVMTRPRLSLPAHISPNWSLTRLSTRALSRSFIVSRGYPSQSIVRFRSTNGKTGSRPSYKTIHILLTERNKTRTFEQAVRPQRVLETWLGFRMDAGGNIGSS